MVTCRRLTNSNPCWRAMVAIETRYANFEIGLAYRAFFRLDGGGSDRQYLNLKATSPTRGGHFTRTLA